MQPVGVEKVSSNTMKHHNVQNFWQYTPIKFSKKMRKKSIESSCTKTEWLTETLTEGILAVAALRDKDFEYLSRLVRKMLVSPVKFPLHGTKCTI